MKFLLKLCDAPIFTDGPLLNMTKEIETLTISKQIHTKKKFSCGL